MSSYLLQCALRDHLEPVLAGLPLLIQLRSTRTMVDSPTQRVPEVLNPTTLFLDDVVPRQEGQEVPSPFVCLQERGGYDMGGMSVVEIILRCAVYSPQQEEAVHELTNLLLSVRHALIPLTQQPLEGRYRLLDTEKDRLLPWEVPTEQNLPYAEASILSVWEYKSMEGV